MAVALLSVANNLVVFASARCYDYSTSAVDIEPQVHCEKSTICIMSPMRHCDVYR